MLPKKRWISTLSLILAVMLLSACTTTVSYNNCPVYPIGGPTVGKEIDTIPYEGYENFWEHQGRLYKLKQELDLCK